MKKKLTSKQYIARYVILKILFGEYELNTWIPSESIMAKQFDTTSLTVRSAYELLINLQILKPVHGKGYLIVNDVIDYIWPIYAKVFDLPFSVKFNNGQLKLIFKNGKNEIVTTCRTNNLTEQLNNLSLKQIMIKIFETKINIDNILNLKIQEMYFHQNQTFTQIVKYYNLQDEHLFEIETSFNLEDINYVLSNEYFLKI